MSSVKLQNQGDGKPPPSWMVPNDGGASASSKEGIETSVEDSEKISAAEKSLLQKVIRKGLVENHHDLEVQRKDPNSPLYSVKTFEALNL